MELSDRIPFSNSDNYKLGVVTYEVTAHFCLEADSLKTKVNRLLISDVQKNNSIRTFAGSQGGDVK